MQPFEADKKRVLIVDDEPLVREAIRRILITAGFQAEGIGGGAEALSLFERDNFDLVIVDYMMPAMTGDKLAAAIRAYSPDQPILMITAYSEMLKSSKSSPESIDFVMTKPFSPRELLNAISRVLSAEDSQTSRS